MTESLSHLPPGRRARTLLDERFGPSIWWVTPHPEIDDSKFMQGVRRRALSEALNGIQDDYEEAI